MWQSAAWFGRARQTVARIYGPESGRTAWYLYREAVVRHEMGQDNAADVLARQALKVYEAAGPAAQRDAGRVASLLGSIALKLGRTEEAQRFAKQPLDVAEKAFGPNSFNTAASLAASTVSGVVLR